MVSVASEAEKHVSICYSWFGLYWSVIMELALAADVKQIIDDCVSSGEFKSPEDVVSAAIHHLQINKTCADFAPGELNRLIAEGEHSGAPVPFEEVRAKLKALRDAHSQGVR
jgi:Arc/MetJ-type ribon-helix-helix transcriptional regulator